MTTRTTRERQERNAPLSVRLDGLCLTSERLVDELWRVRSCRRLSEPAKAQRMEQTIATFLYACRLEELREATCVPA